MPRRQRRTPTTFGARSRIVYAQARPANDWSAAPSPLRMICGAAAPVAGRDYELFAGMSSDQERHAGHGCQSPPHRLVPGRLLSQYSVPGEEFGMGLISLLGELLNLSGAPSSPSPGPTGAGSAGPIFGGGGPGGPSPTNAELGGGGDPGAGSPGFGGGGSGPGSGGPPPPEADRPDECN